jgi:hypothetical protein
MRSGQRRTTLCPGTQLGASRSCSAVMCSLYEPRADILLGSSTLQAAKARTGRGSLAKRQVLRRSGFRARADMRGAGGRIGRPGLSLAQAGRVHLLRSAARSIRRWRMRLARMCWRNSTTSVDSSLPCSRSSAPRPARDGLGRGNC